MNNHKLGILFSCLSVILMSIESPFIKLSNLYWADSAFLLGFALALSSNFVLSLKGKDYLINSYKTETKILLISGFSTGIGNIAFVSATIYGGVANTVLILATTPIFSALLMWVLYKKRSQKSLFVAIFFIFIGLYIILQNNLGGGSFLGTILAFLCVGFLILTLISLSNFKKANKLVYISISGFCLFIFSFPFSSFDIDINSSLYILFIGLFTMPLSRYLLGLGAKRILPQELSLLLILESVLAPLFAWWWIGDKPPLTTFIGGFIILITLIIYILINSKNK